MKEIVVSKKEEGKKVFPLLCAHLPNAPGSVLHKSIRNKNITLNKKKTKEDERVVAGDIIQLFFSDETYEKFSALDAKDDYVERIKVAKSDIEVVYEDEDIMAINKSVGVLSQKAKDDDVSINEMAISYLLKNKKITEEELKVFRPSVANRLDRNTSGIVMFGKTIKGLKFLSEGISKKTIHKYYMAVVDGQYSDSGSKIAYLKKNESTNQVVVKNQPFDGASKIETRIDNCEYIKEKNITKVTIELLSGKSHQIRAYMASIKHPLIGDPKYGNGTVNKKYGMKNQMLHAFRVEVPDKELIINTALPAEWKKVLE